MFSHFKRMKHDDDDEQPDRKNIGGMSLPTFTESNQETLELLSEDCDYYTPTQSSPEPSTQNETKLKLAPKMIHDDDDEQPNWKRIGGMSLPTFTKSNQETIDSSSEDCDYYTPAQSSPEPSTQNETLLMLASKMIHDDDDEQPDWQRNGGMSLPTFTESNQETMDLLSEDCDYYTPAQSSPEPSTQNETLLMLASKMIHDDDDEQPDWQRNGGMSLPTFTESNQETIDSSSEDCDYYTPAQSSPEPSTQNETLLMLASKMIHDDDDEQPDWQRNGGMSLPTFTESNQETMDLLREDCDLYFPTISSPELDLTAISPMECSYQMNDASDIASQVVGSADLEATSMIPSVVRFPGTSQFHLDSEGIKETKFYSTGLEKIFVTRNTKVPMKFVCDWNLEFGLISNPSVRAVLLFQSAEIVDIIESCPIHVSPADDSNRNADLLEKSRASHVLRCYDSRAIYCTDKASGRLSVVVPLNSPQAGANTTTIMYSFGCLNTCLGIKRRPTLIVFTLEDSQGKVFGRDLLHIQVSASPKRDMKNAEKVSGLRPAKQGFSEKRKATPAPAKDSCKLVTSEASDGFRMVPVLNDAHYERVLEYAHSNLLLRIDKEQREAMPREYELLSLYTDDNQTNKHDTQNETLLMLASKMIHDDDDEQPDWQRNGGMSLPTFTESNQETMDLLREDCDLYFPTISSPELDLTAISPMECSYQMNDASDIASQVVGSADLEATSMIPSVVRFPGTSQFHLDSEGIKETKFYSTGLEKIFVTRNTKVPMKFVCDWNLEFGLISNPSVRAVLLFQSAEIVDIIESCPIHVSPADDSNRNADLLEKSRASHVLRCYDSRAIYCTDKASGRLSVVVPLNSPQAGANTTTIMYSFGCLNTCLGIKRRPTLIVFTLEDSQGKVFGRDLLHIQVSASPKRDMKNAEKVSGLRPAKQGFSEKRKATPAPAKDSCKLVTSEASDGFRMVPVLNDAHYERVLEYAHSNLLFRIDKEQREAMPREYELLSLYTDDNQTNKHDT